MARTSLRQAVGAHYHIPYQGADATGLGKPLKSILHGRADLPIYLAAIGPQNVQLSAEITDGWLPIFFSPQHYDAVIKRHAEAGLACAADGRTIADLDIAPSVTVMLADDLQKCFNIIKPMLALYISGMGARRKNFYHDLACRYGFEAGADAIQKLYLSAQKHEAIDAVSDELVYAVSLCGSKARIKDRPHYSCIALPPRQT